MNKRKYIALSANLISWAFIILFIYAASCKLLDFELFRVQLSKSPLLTAFADQFAWSVPLLEVIIAVMLANTTWQLKGLYAAFTLMVTFSAYIVAILKFSYYIPCSCGGILQNMTWTQHLIFNFFFVLLAVAGVLIYPNNKRSIAIEGNAENLKQSRQTLI